MGNKLEHIKKNNKSDVYENDSYIVRIKQVSGGFYVKNGSSKNPYWDPTKSDDEPVWIDDAVILEAENKNSGKIARKRCYQGASAIDDFQDALDGKSSRFADVLNKLNKH